MRFTTPMQQRLRPAIAGLVAGALGLGLSELLAGAVAGAPSLVTVPVKAPVVVTDPAEIVLLREIRDSLQTR